MNLCKTILISAAIAIAMALGATGNVSAQSTDGAIAGVAVEGETVHIRGLNGFSREIEITKTGKYNVRHLPAGSYNVIRIDAEGNVVSSQSAEVIVGRTARLK